MEVQAKTSPPITKDVILSKSSTIWEQLDQTEVSYTKIENRVATIEFGHPASNSFVFELLVRLSTELRSLSDNKEVSVIILKSEGNNTFCAGASFNELMAVSTAEEGRLFF